MSASLRILRPDTWPQPRVAGVSATSHAPAASGHSRLRWALALVIAISHALTASAFHIVLTNDDGFESTYVQALFTTLKAAGHDVILSAPYSDQSGSSAHLGTWIDLPRTSLQSPGGHVAAGSPGVGSTSMAADQFYVDSTPVAAMLYGVSVAAQAKWGGPPDLVIAGPNIGSNLGRITIYSGTIGAVVTALNIGLPAIAVSATNGEPDAAPLAAALTLRMLSAFDNRGQIALPPAIGLNINLPPLDPARSAASYPIAFTQIDSGDATAEVNVFSAGTHVTVSPLQSTYHAGLDAASAVLAQLRPVLPAAPSLPNPKLLNASSRALAGYGNQAQFLGIVVGGHVAKTVLIRGSGPALARFGVTGVLADPALRVFDGNNRLVGANDNWGEDPATARAIAAAAARVGAFAWPEGSRDAALILTLSPGNYTIELSGPEGAPSGVALIETYDIELE